MFLFQIGTIKREQCNQHTLQYYTGFYSRLVRLKGLMSSMLNTMFYFSFYSRLVRLKVRNLTKPSTSKSSFYSKLVRLKDTKITSTIQKSFQFLFQIGTIKSGGESGLGAGAKKSFYSKVVRLKVETLVQTIQKVVCFYSKLVRLKVPVTVATPAGAGTFLFQIGTIKSGFNYNDFIHFTCVSIPNWYD